MHSDRPMTGASTGSSTSAIFQDIAERLVEPTRQHGPNRAGNSNGHARSWPTVRRSKWCSVHDVAGSRALDRHRRENRCARGDITSNSRQRAPATRPTIDRDATRQPTSGGGPLAPAEEGRGGFEATVRRSPSPPLSPRQGGRVQLTRLRPSFASPPKNGPQPVTSSIRQSGCGASSIATSGLNRRHARASFRSAFSSASGSCRSK